MDEPGVTIGQAAALYGLTPSTLRWWERTGVLPAPPRGPDDRRIYNEVDLRRIGYAYLCCVVGRMPLRSAADVVSGKADASLWQATIHREVRRLDEQIQQLTAARDYLGHLTCCPDDDPALCPYLDHELRTRTPLGNTASLSLIAAARARHENTDHRHENHADPSRCPVCDAAMAQPPRGRPRTYCSATCRQRAHRRRHATNGTATAGAADISRAHSDPTTPAC